MKSVTNIIGIVLIVVGILVLSYQGITYTETERVAEVNIPPVASFKVVQDKTKTIPLPPILGGLCIVAGVVLLVIARINPK